MTGDVSTGNRNASLTLTIRLTTSVRFTIGSGSDANNSITPSSTVRRVKEIISQCQECEFCAVERQRLIYRGRILSENDRTLADYGIGTGGGAAGDEIVLYLVIGSAPSGGGGVSSPTQPASDQPTSPTQDPYNPFGNLSQMMSNMNNNNGAPDLAAFQQQMQQNPNMMNDMMNNPMVQSMLSNPDFMRNMMENNSMMRGLMESNPELRHALEDPELMRRSLEMMRDPSAMQVCLFGACVVSTCFDLVFCLFIYILHLNTCRMP